ncbi:protein MTSS 1 isoform X2 [Hoplias malabaricus]|uniref:protein MTSS 1 isoform X2 n=1 Tax=Hoplias malabaricus TaxID=27720 RepID=UPI0034623DC1
MDAGMEKECSALGGLFQTIMNDMKASYPVWEDFVTKGTKLQSQLRTTILVTSSFLDAFQKVADIATGTRGATKEIGSALTRMCMRHRSIEGKLKLFTTALMDNLISPLELKIEEWKKVASQLDKDHAKEYKKARADIKKKSSDTVKLQKKVKKGKDEVRLQLDSALQDVNSRYAELEETEKRAVCRALMEERGRFCSFVSMLKPVLDEEISVLGEVTHLQSILEDLCSLTVDPNTLPPASEQVILDLKGSDYIYSYQTPPASPSNTLSRKSSISSNYATVRHVPSLDSISSAVDGLHLRGQDSGQRSPTPLLLVGGEGGSRSLSEGNSPSVSRPRLRHRNTLRSIEQSGVHSQAWSQNAAENGTSLPPPPLQNYSLHGERTRAQSTSGKPQSAREQLALTLSGGLNSDAPRTSRDSLHCSSGYSTQTTTPSCSEDTIPSQHDYDYISLHGGDDGHAQSDFDKSSTIPRNSDLSQNYRKLFKRPASTVSLLLDPEPLLRQPQTATIRRKPSSKPSIRRGTISGGVPIPICTPQVPLKPSVSTVGLSSAGSGSEEMVCPPGPNQTLRAHGSDLIQSNTNLVKHSLCASTQSLSAMPPPYYAMFPGQPPVGSTEQLYQMSKQQQYALHQQQQRQYQQQYNQQQQQQYQQQQQHQQQQIPQYNQQQQSNQQLQQYNQEQQSNQQQHPQQQLQQYNQQQSNQQQPQQQLQQYNQQQPQIPQYNQQQQLQQYNQQQQSNLLHYNQQLVQQQKQYNQQQQQQHYNHHQQLQQPQSQYNQQEHYDQQPPKQYNQHQQPPQYQQHYNHALQQQHCQQQPAQHSQPPKQHPTQQQQEPNHPSEQPLQQSAIENSCPAEPAEGATYHSDDAEGVQASGGDMLSIIRRGVKLRRTLTNDRSAPFITKVYDK